LKKKETNIKKRLNQATTCAAGETEDMATVDPAIEGYNLRGGEYTGKGEIESKGRDLLRVFYH